MTWFGTSPIPEPLTVATPDDRDEAPVREYLEHQPHLAAAPPLVVLTLHAHVILDLAGQERAALLELTQHVAAEGGVRLQELAAAPAGGVAASRAAHARAEQRQVVGRPDEGAPLDELALLPEQPVELGAVEGIEPAPEDEVLRRRDGRDRVDLQEAEPAYGVQDVRRGAVE